jgi:integrase
VTDTGGRRGSVRKDPARGSWYVIADVAEVGALQRKQVRRRGFASEREAHRALTKLLGELDAGSYVQPDLKTTLTEYVTETWLPSLVVRNRRPSTLESYRRNLEVHVLPRLGTRPLVRVTTADLDRLYADLLVGPGDRRKLAPRTVRYIHTILHGVFGHAVQKGHLAVNPCLRADAPEPKACRSRTMKTWTAAQMRTFLGSLDGDRFRAPLLLLATTGMRRGEALGLKWSDLRLDEGELDIVRSLGLVNDRLVVGDPKTERGRRIVSLDPATVVALRQHRAEQVQERLLIGPGYLDEDWVFAMPDGRPTHPGRFTRVFDRRGEAAGLPRIRLHDLRHTWATLALRAGINPKVVQERIGHASVAITLDLYTHVDRETHAAAAAAVSGLFLDPVVSGG